MSANPIDKLFEDKRPIAEMAFGAEEKTPEARAETATQVRALLTAAGVKVADDINRLGCTGMMESSTIDEAKFLRLGLAGGGVGLPCFVPISRYCLVHDTIGGLEPGQKQHHEEFVNHVSRELTPEEHGKVKLIELARKRGRRNTDLAADILGGRDESMLEEVPDKTQTPSDTPVADAEAALRRRLYEAELAAGLQATAREQAEERAFKCPEHNKLNWACRHCIAQAIVEGELEPVCFVSSGKPGPNEAGQKQALGEVLVGNTVEQWLDHCDARGDTKADVYARVATFTRKLSRD